MFEKILEMVLKIVFAGIMFFIFGVLWMMGIAFSSGAIIGMIIHTIISIFGIGYLVYQIFYGWEH